MKWIIAIAAAMSVFLFVDAAELATCGKQETAVDWTVPRTFQAPNGQTLLYRWMEPAKVEVGKPYPLVVLLHGAGERGTDNRLQLVHGGRQLLAWGREWKLPFVLVAPQCPGGKQWVDTPWGALAHTMPESPSETLALAMELLDNRLAALPVDHDRVYATGVSMGGYGVWDLLQRRPGFFAAAVPVCGGGDTNLASRLVSVPIRAFHGKADGVVPPFRAGRLFFSHLLILGFTAHYSVRRCKGVRQDACVELCGIALKIRPEGIYLSSGRKGFYTISRLPRTRAPAGRRSWRGGGSQGGCSGCPAVS